MTTKQALRRWKRACERWVSRLGLYDYQRTYTLADEVPPEYRNSAASGSWVANCETSTRYKWLKTKVLLDYVLEVDDDELDETACHEIVHAVLDPIDDMAGEVIAALPKFAQRGFEVYRAAALERTTTHLTRVLRALGSS